MPSMTPTESAIDKAVDTFGLGTYDSPESSAHGEDSNERFVKKTLPDAGGPLDPFGPDRLLGYPQVAAADAVIVVHGKHRRPTDPGAFGSFRDMELAEEDEADKPPASELPNGGDPSARSDYYDHSVIGSVDDIWADEDAGAYASEDESLPTPEENDVTTDNFLGALGNAMSGRVIQDQSVPSGFPVPADSPASPFYSEHPKTASEAHVIRISTNIDEVRDLAKGVIKAHGKKGLTRRHVMSYLQKEGSHQFLSSDVVRCLVLDHDVEIKDLLDEFPMAEGVKKLSSVRDGIVAREAASIRSPGDSLALRIAAGAITRAIADLERIGVRNG